MFRKSFDIFVEFLGYLLGMFQGSVGTFLDKGFRYLISRVTKYLIFGSFRDVLDSLTLAVSILLT